MARSVAGLVAEVALQLLGELLPAREDGFVELGESR
jgi:hypothetical protein